MFILFYRRFQRFFTHQHTDLVSESIYPSLSVYYNIIMYSLSASIQGYYIQRVFGRRYIMCTTSGCSGNENNANRSIVSADLQRSCPFLGPCVSITGFYSLKAGDNFICTLPTDVIYHRRISRRERCSTTPYIIIIYSYL